MDHYSFQGPYAYRWLDDVPVERIDLRSGERRGLVLGSPPASRSASPASVSDRADQAERDEPRALMAAWN